MYNFSESFDGDGSRTDFALSFKPAHEDGDALDDFMKITIIDESGKWKVVMKSNVTLYEKTLTLTHPIPERNKLLIEYNR